MPLTWYPTTRAGAQETSSVWLSYFVFSPEYATLWLVPQSIRLGTRTDTMMRSLLWRKELCRV